MRLATLPFLMMAAIAVLPASITQDAARATLELARVIAAPHRTPATASAF